MKPVSLADITYEQGLQLLALRKQAMDSGRIRRMTPEALANTFPLHQITQAVTEKAAEGGLLDSLKSGIGEAKSQLSTGAKGLQDQWAGIDPSARRALTHSLLGAGAGAATGAAAAKRHGTSGVGRSALRGGLAGAALGGGLSLATNPGLADKAQGKIDALLARAQAQAKPEPTAEASVPSAEEISKLTNTATSSTPELAALASGAGIAAGTGAGYKVLRDRTSYDPSRLRDHLKSLTKEVKGKNPLGGSSQRLVSDAQLDSAFGPDTAAMTAKGHGPNVFGQMRGAPGRIGTTKDVLSRLIPEDKLEAATRASTTSGFFNTPPPQAPSLGGGLNKQNLGRLRTEGKAYGKDLLKSVRPGRAGGLAALLGSGLLAAGSTGLNYLHNRNLRNDAAEQLQQLNQSQP